MSFYGEQPKLSEINFKFSGYYPNRKKLLDNLTSAEGISLNSIPIGAYILISYFISPTANTNTADILSQSPGRYTKNGTNPTNGTLTYNVTQTTNYTTNLRTDLENYGNNYHNTVWQRVTSNGNNTFIMIAELNSLAPQLDIEYLPSAKKTNANADKKERKTYTVKDNYTSQSGVTGDSPIGKLISFLGRNGIQPYSVLNKETSGDPRVDLIYYNKPELDLEASSELGYKIKMPTIPYFIFNLQKGNHESDGDNRQDSINVAYDSVADAYVLNMFLGNMEDYMTKASTGIIITSGNTTPQPTDRIIGFNAYWNNLDTIMTWTN